MDSSKNKDRFRARERVHIADDFRDNLIIDRYDPIFVGMRAGKQKHLRSANSEDAVTWNVFRSLRQIDPRHWLPELTRIGLPNGVVLPIEGVAVYLWASRCPPPGLLLFGDEGDSEIDVVIESPSWVWCIEAKLYSDISTGTTTRQERDQIIRNIDVGSFHAGVRDFYFSLLLQDKNKSRLGTAAIAKYQDLEYTRSLLKQHRPDGLQNLGALSVLAWADLGRVLETAQATAQRASEKDYAKRALQWLANKGLVMADSVPSHSNVSDLGQTNSSSAGWSDWRPYPDPRNRDRIVAPVGPGVYELRRRDTQELILRGKGRCCAQRMSSLLPAPFGSGTRRNQEKRRYVLAHMDSIEYRTHAYETDEEATAVERQLNLSMPCRFDT